MVAAGGLSIKPAAAVTEVAYGTRTRLVNSTLYPVAGAGVAGVFTLPQAALLAAARVRNKKPTSISKPLHDEGLRKSDL